MATVAIGSLRIDLALATAKFKEGAKKAAEISKRLSERIKKHSAAIKAAFKVAAVAAAAFAAGLALAVRGSLKEFDKLAKMSRSVGVPIEQLSALGHAAELSGASVDDLGKAFRNFARNAQSAARGPNDFSRSLDMLNVSWREADGQFRKADEVMMDVADRFAQMEDGAGKTALAMRIFGEERGPKLISFLNSGSEGLRAMSAEAAQLGLVISTKAAVQAERFNDNVDRLGKQVTGFSNSLTEKVTPALNLMIEKFLAWTSEGSRLRGMAENIAYVFNSIVSAGLQAADTIGAVWARMKLFADNVSGLFSESMAERQARIREVDAGILADQKETAAEIAQLWADVAATKAGALGAGAAGGDAGGGAGAGGLEEPPLVTSAKAETEALRLRNQQLAAGKSLMEQLRTPQEAMIAEQERINELMRVGAIDAETYGRAMRQATALSARNMDALASSVSSALGSIFGESKGVAIAQALINTYQGISKAIATYPPPISGIMAGIQAAAGFAQVAAIRRTTKSGGGSGGSSAGASAGAGAAAAPAQPQQMATINVHGERFGRDQVRGLIEQLNAAIGDGAQLNVRMA
jgi:hypothetical protein